tara:strand:- start:29871 stop:30134 length:264 start_codon:yes stop_codon:yes gene_type:complete
MNEEQLKKGNSLDDNIRYLRIDISKLQKCIKNVIIDEDYCVQESHIEINIGDKRCKVSKETLEEFLKRELTTVKENKGKLEQEFKQL